MKIWLLLGFAASALFGQQAVEYRLSFPNAAHHEAQVKATFRNISTPVLEAVMSNSSPGRYAIHSFAKNVYDLRASDDQGRSLPIAQISPSQWNVSGHHGTVVLDYIVFGDHADGTYDGIDASHAHLNMPATLIWAHGFEKTPATLEFDIPSESNWKVATQLASNANDTWSAPNVDMLMDSPVELSAFNLQEWTIDGRRFRLTLHDRGSEQDAAGFAKMCENVVLEAAGVFGKLPEYDHGSYTFLVDTLPYVFGDGMEHRDSTVITVPLALHDNQKKVLGAVSHEFLHSWNVERIRPKSIEPFDFERANMSGELWFAEGFTSYYGPLVLHRSGLNGLDAFVRSMGAAVNAVMTMPGKDVFNAPDMSRRAPFVDAAKSIDEVNTSNIYISYYIYGEALALGADLSIRKQFPGKSLDDWMRAMWQQHPDAKKPYSLADLESALASVTDSTFARDMFQRYVLGKETMPYEQLLAQAGIVLRKASPEKAWLGVSADSLTFGKSGATITKPVLRGSPVYNAGLDNGDTIVELDGKPIQSEDQLNDLLKAHKPGDRLQAKAETRTGSRSVELIVSALPKVELVPFEEAGQILTPEIKDFRNAWLSSKAIHKLQVTK